MSTYHGEEKCARYIQVYACHLDDTEVLFKSEVRTPTPDTMFDELIECIQTATDHRIRNIDPTGLGAQVAGELAAAEPWTLTLWDNNPKYLLYKLWYDCTCLKLGLMPQVALVSDKKPIGMPEHWNFVYTRNPDEVQCDNQCGGFVNPNCLDDDQYNLAEEGHGYACCEACKNKIVPMYMHDPYEDPGFEEQPHFNPYPLRNRVGINRLTYNNKGQTEIYTWA